MTRRLPVVAMMLACMIATPAAARHQSTKTDSQVTQYCGDRVCSIAGQAVAAPAKTPRRVKVARGRSKPIDGNGNPMAHSASGGYVTIDTASGIKVTVAPQFAAPIAGFIGDLVARGYMPKKIHCLNFSKSHVPGSLHFRGLACDFDQRGWGKTASAMYRVADLAAKWGLRDGGEFRDWGHIDMGPHLRRGRARMANLYEAVDGYHRKRGKIYR